MQSPLYIGVDVAKAEVVVACAHNTFPVRSVANELGELKTFLNTLPPGSIIAMEATGSYHMALADLAHGLGFHVYVLNPRDLFYYARGVGLRAKTDRVDACMIARYVLSEGSRLHRYQPPTLAQRQLDELLKCRATVVRQKGALQQSCAQLAMCEQEIREVLEKYDALLEKMDDELVQLMKSIPERMQQQKLLQTIVGVGPLTAAWLTNLFERVAFRSSDAVVAFVGLDPRACDSGQKRGRRRLSKRGPAEGRRLLFTAGMAAAKSRRWKAQYEQYRARGLATTEAVLLLARKILRIAFAMYRSGESFRPG